MIQKLEKPDLTKVETMVTNFVQEIETNGFEWIETSFPQFRFQVFDAALEAYYGPDIFDCLDKIGDEIGYPKAEARQREKDEKLYEELKKKLGK